MRKEHWESPKGSAAPAICVKSADVDWTQKWDEWVSTQMDIQVCRIDHPQFLYPKKRPYPIDSRHWEVLWKAVPDGSKVNWALFEMEEQWRISSE